MDMPKLKFNWQEMADKGHCIDYKRDNEKQQDVVVWSCRVSDILDLVHSEPDEKYHKNVSKWNSIKKSKNRSDTIRWQQISTKEAIKRSSWPEGLEYMDKYVCDLDSGPMSNTFRRVRAWGEDGDDFCRDRFDAGDIDCWRTMKRNNVNDYKSGIIDMTIAFGGNCDKTAEQLIWGGAAAALLVDKLEDVGYRVNITGVIADIGLYDGFCSLEPLFIHKLVIKESDQPLDIDTLLMAVASPWFFRVHIFRSYLESPFNVDSTLGRISRIPKQFCGRLHVDHIYSKEKAQQYLDDVVKMFDESQSLYV